MIKQLLKNLYKTDPYLKPYESSIKRRLDRVKKVENYILTENKSLKDFANAHLYFGLHLIDNEWIFREWAPNATKIYIVCNASDWKETPEFLLKRISADGIWEIKLSVNTFKHKDLYKLRIWWDQYLPDKKEIIHVSGDRLPAYATRVIQDENTVLFDAQVEKPDKPYKWKCEKFKVEKKPLFIYEAHIGMACEEEKVGTYKEFTEFILPRIKKNGYNAIQLMAIQEHPYYGSFGYHVSNFFAASSRFGTSDDLKELIDTAHGLGIIVIMDIVHSHAVLNEVEGLSRFDGTSYQYFHDGGRGLHSAWNSRCFDYGKLPVIKFLLSNCRYWLEEYKFDGFRFDGVTSLLYLDHGLGKAFTSYDDYYGSNVDNDAVAYLTLANKLIHSIRPDAISIAEDISGLPGLAINTDKGGCGFDYRFSMGVPDLWTKTTKETKDEHWPIGHIFYELTNRRKFEKSISYAESHDQALVGDQTIIFRLIGADMYDHMQVIDDNINVNRGIALHKLIRFITLTTAGNGYLNFMGNEFGHPEWIDFPRQENNWSYKYAKRQWHLADDSNLKYKFLQNFDNDMIEFAKKYKILEDEKITLLCEHAFDMILAYKRASLVFVFNFHPTRSHVDFVLPLTCGNYKKIFDTDDCKYGGTDRLKTDLLHKTKIIKNIKDESSADVLSLYIPTRTALVLQMQDKTKVRTSNKKK